MWFRLYISIANYKFFLEESWNPWKSNTWLANRYSLYIVEDFCISKNYSLIFMQIILCVYSHLFLFISWKITSSLISRKGCTNVLYNNQNKKLHYFFIVVLCDCIKGYLEKNRSIESFGRNFTFYASKIILKEIRER